MQRGGLIFYFLLKNGNKKALSSSTFNNIKRSPNPIRTSCCEDIPFPKCRLLILLKENFVLPYMLSLNLPLKWVCDSEKRSVKQSRIIKKNVLVQDGESARCTPTPPSFLQPPLYPMSESTRELHIPANTVPA